MQRILAGFTLDDATWLYLSFLLIVAVYFKFSRVWSIRNLDLLLLLGLSPGVLLLRQSDESLVLRGNIWLFVGSALALLRVLADGLIVRRPRLEQNMNAAGMNFLCAATVVFLTTKLFTEPLQQETVDVLAPSVAQHTSALHRVWPDSRETLPAIEDPTLLPGPLAGDSAPDERLSPTPSTPPAPGPTTALVKRAVGEISRRMAADSPSGSRLGEVESWVIRGLAILSHLAVLVGLSQIGRRIYADADVGFAMGALYMLLPCTAYDLGMVQQVLPAALVVGAIAAYRSPIASGCLLGLASGMVFFPAFLFPLWAGFYGRKGGWRFAGAVVVTTVLVVATLALVSQSASELIENTLGYVHWTRLSIWEEPDRQSVWGLLGEAWRLPVLVSFLILLAVLTVWPRGKTLAELIPQTAAIVLGAQLWYPQRGGVDVLGSLPLLLLVVFRPTLTGHGPAELSPFRWFWSKTTPASPAGPAEARA
ncbi:MAG: hypothetical protein ACKOGA_05280 [Planctomycetaceae bacterium]